MNCCSTWHVIQGVGAGGGAAMSQSRKREDRHESVERCYKEGMVISTTGEASLILT